LPAGQWALKNIDLEKAQKYLDFINLMTYDFAGPWEPLSGHHAQLFAPRHPHNEAARTSCEAVVKYVLSEGVPSKKLLMGIPTYGRSCKLILGL
jgi:chitinase